MQQQPYVAFPKSITETYQRIPPANYQQGSPPFANQSFDRFNVAYQPLRPYRYLSQPVQHRQRSLRQRQPMPPRFSRMPIPVPHRAPYQYNQSQQLQPHEMYPSNPNDPTLKTSTFPSSLTPKPHVKEFKDDAFIIESNGTPGQRIQGLVSNDTVDNSLKNKDAKVKIAKINRTAKVKDDLDWSDDEYERIPLDSAFSRTINQSSAPFPPKAPDTAHRSISNNDISSQVHNEQQQVSNNRSVRRTEW